MRAAPVRPREMTTTSIEAIVISRLRRRLVAVSLTTYPPEIAISTPPFFSESDRLYRLLSEKNERRRPSGEHPVDAAGLISHDGAAVELDDPAPHRVDDALVVGGHHDGGSGAVDPVQQPHEADGGVRVELAGGHVYPLDQRPVSEGAGARHQ